MEERIFEICGKSGDLVLLNQIGNDPNFVFKNDPNFQTIILFNDAGTRINVNSWIECANYVNGGWISDSIDLINGEKIVFFSLLIIFVVRIVALKFFKVGSD